MATKPREQPSIGRELLFDILSWARPHDSECELAFLREYLDKIPGMEQDDFGNRFIRIGESNVMWSCHVDTVSSKPGLQRLRFNHATGIVELDKGKPGQSLGADDGAGLWIMLEMIRHNRPGFYVFHRGEERGCLGSSWIMKNNKAMFDGIDAAVAFDRAHLGDVITHQSFGRTCSDAFAKSMAEQLNRLDGTFAYRPDDTGVYTDTNEYAGEIPECSNLSVGYYGQHGPRETLDVYHVEKLLAAMLQFETSELVIERDPSVWEDDRYMGYGGYHGGRVDNWRLPPKTELEEMTELIEDHPRSIAKLMIEQGVTASDLYSYLYPPAELLPLTPLERTEEAARRAWGDELEWDSDEDDPVDENRREWEEWLAERQGDGEPLPVDEAIKEVRTPAGFHNALNDKAVGKRKRGNGRRRKKGGTYRPIME